MIPHLAQWMRLQSLFKQSVVNKYITLYSKQPSLHFFINIVHTTSNLITMTVNNYNDNGKIEQKQYNLQSVHALSIITFMSSTFVTGHVTPQKQQWINQTPSFVNSIATTDETLKDIKLFNIIFWHWTFITYIMKIYNLPTSCISVYMRLIYIYHSAYILASVIVEYLHSKCVCETERERESESEGVCVTERNTKWRREKMTVVLGIFFFLRELAFPFNTFINCNKSCKIILCDYNFCSLHIKYCRFL